MTDVPEDKLAAKVAGYQAAAERLSAKLQEFYASLPPDEKLVMYNLLGQMSEHAVGADDTSATVTIDLPDIDSLGD